MKAVTEKNLQIATVVICILLVVFALLIIVPLAILQASLDGQCILYADSEDFGSKSVCGYPIAVAVLFQLLYCTARFILVLLFLPGVLTIEALSPKRFAVPCAIADVAACLLTLISSGIISHGFSVMCSNVFFPNSDRCGTVGIYISTTDSFMDNYYQRLNVAEIGVWPSWVLWILLILVDVLTLSKTGLLPVSLPSSLPFSLPRFGASGNSASAAGSSRTGEIAVVSGSSSAASDTGSVAAARAQFSPVVSGSRTPPPNRPVPPRPVGGPAVTKPLMPAKGEDSDEEIEYKMQNNSRPIYKRTVSPT